MPVILQEHAESAWLDLAQEDAEVLQSLLVPYPSALMAAFAVSPLVNSVKNNAPKCIEPI